MDVDHRNGGYLLSGNSTWGDIFPRESVRERKNIETNDDPYAEPDLEQSAVFSRIGLKD
ncbi:hypothetical protein [Paraburkholderia sediminicola]|uniref:hypothetical protein n=1 Tax=Paraburkholderia sediminicola TaxID=458836 RepID=UPI0038B840B5